MSIILAIDRRNEILKKVQTDKSVKVPELSKLYQVTEETIRRDLEKLEADGHIKRTYGGAVLNESTNADLPASIRETTNTDGKNKIGMKASTYINDGATIIMDSSTTSLYVAKYLKEKMDITIITNSLKIPNELLTSPNSQVIVTGGTLNAKSMSFVGHLAEDAFDKYFVDWAVLSCRGLSETKGATEPNDMEAEIKKCMIRSAEKVMLVVDQTKFDHKAFVKSFDLKNVDVVITDEALSDKWQEYFKELGIEVVYA